MVDRRQIRWTVIGLFLSGVLFIGGGILYARDSASEERLDWYSRGYTDGYEEMIGHLCQGQKVPYEGYSRDYSKGHNDGATDAVWEIIVFGC